MAFTKPSAHRSSSAIGATTENQTIGRAFDEIVTAHIYGLGPSCPVWQALGRDADSELDSDFPREAEQLRTEQLPNMKIYEALQYVEAGLAGRLNPQADHRRLKQEALEVLAKELRLMQVQLDQLAAQMPPSHSMRVLIANLTSRLGPGAAKTPSAAQSSATDPSATGAHTPYHGSFPGPAKRVVRASLVSQPRDLSKGVK